MNFKLTDILEKAGAMQKEVSRLQEIAAQKTSEISVGGGMVKVTVNGRQEILSIIIDPEVLKMNDKSLLEDLIKGAVNQALENSKKMMTDELGKMAGALGPLASMFKGM